MHVNIDQNKIWLIHTKFNGLFVCFYTVNVQWCLSHIKLDILFEVWSIVWSDRQLFTWNTQQSDNETMML